jgi:competence protein ComFC
VNVLPQITKLGGAALDLVFPRFCVGCGKAGNYICDTCRLSLPYIEPPTCPLCGEPQTNEGLCFNCSQWQADIDGIRAPFRFEGVIREAVHRLKYNNLRAIAASLAKLMVDHLDKYPVSADVLIPVPLHPKRLRERGYNQSALLARHIGKIKNLQVDETSLVRTLYILPQARTASVQARRINVTGGFTCFNDKMKDKEIILIDDVSTSGATLNACAVALKARGAKAVQGLSLAKEI